MSNARGFKSLWLVACMCSAIIANSTMTTMADTTVKSKPATVGQQTGRVVNESVNQTFVGGEIRRLAPMESVMPIEGPVESDEAAGMRGGGCEVVYRNTAPETGNFAFIIAGSGLFTADTCTMVGTNRAICSVMVVVGSFGGIPAYPLRCMIWNTTAPFCPDDGAFLFAEVLHLTVAPTFHNETYVFDDIIVPSTINIALSTTVATTANAGPAWGISEGFGAGEVGTSADLFIMHDADAPPGCEAVTNFFFGGPPTIANFAIEIQAGPGPSGACCNQQTGDCEDEIPLSECLEYFHRWTAGLCTEADPCEVCDIVQGAGTPPQIGCVADIDDNEPDCGPEYDDNTNSGCAFSDDLNDPDVTDIACDDVVYGTMGTYEVAGDPRRDNDYYRFTLTSTQRVTWTVTGEAPANATIFVPLGPTPCGDLLVPAFAGDVGSDTSDAGCQQAIATACLPAGTYYAVARTATSTGFPCGIEYCATLICEPCSPTLGACCLPNDICEQRSELHCIISGGVYEGDGVDCKDAVCPPTPTNDTCSTKINLTGTVMVSFDTTFAQTEDTLNVADCGDGDVPIFRDLWYGYTIEHPTAIRGRLVASTYDSCVDTRLAVYLVSEDCTGMSQGDECTAIGTALICNDDINFGRGNFASYVIVSDIGSGPPPVGSCFKIRVGTFDETEANRGEGMLRIDFVPTASSPWTEASGRCCWPDGGCAITSGDDETEQDCESQGGFFTNFYDPTEGDPALTAFGIGVGCKTLPCPEIGEACFKPFRTNDNTAQGGQGPLLLPSGFGTVTKAVRKRTFFKYKIPNQPTKALVFNTCGSAFDTVLALYEDGAVNASGECVGTPFAMNDECSPDEASGTTAQGVAPCFGAGQSDSCLCRAISTDEESPMFVGKFIYIEVGAFNSITGSPQTTIDPVPENCGTPVELSLTVTLADECFACIVECPPVHILENEPDCFPEYEDTTNGGCNSDPNVFSTIACGQTVCGTYGTYTFTEGTQTLEFRDLDWYRLSVATARTVDISIIGGFRPQITLYLLGDPGNPCAGSITGIATTTAGASCEAADLSAAVCPGEYLIIVGTNNVFTGIDCGTDYTMSVACNNPPAQDCCKGDMNNDGKRNGADVRQFVKSMLASPITLFPVGGCYNLNVCRGDINGDYILNVADTTGFVNLLLTAANCPATGVCVDPAKCHVTSSDGGAVSSVLGPIGCNERTADDFRPSIGGNITSVCWHGFYLNLGGGTVCSNQAGTGDAFSITIFNDNAGVPGTVNSGPHAVTPTKTADGAIPPIGTFASATQWRYEATIPSVAVTAGTCYWIEIVNSISGECCWLWSLANTSNNVSASRTGGSPGQANYTASNLLDGDFAFCLDNIRIDKQDCGLPQGRCCDEVLACSVTDEPTCLNIVGGTWTAGGNCAGPCPLPAADLCPNAAALTLNSVTEGTTIGLTPSAGLVPLCESAGAGQNTSADGWYTFTPTVAGLTTVSACALPNSYDMIMVVYSGGCGALTEVACNDDGCAPGGTSRAQWTAAALTTYRVRITGWHGGEGAYSIVVTQP